MNWIRPLVISLLVLPAIGLLIFGPRPIEPAPDQRVVVDYWEKWTGREGSQIRIIVDEFNNSVGKEKGIFVRLVSTSDIGRKVLLATAAGVPPDVAGLWDGNIVQYASQNALQPLDDLAAEYGITSGYYKPIYWDGCHYQGKLYALISTPMAVALHYNKRIFQESADQLRAAGLDPDRPPRTIAELDQYAKVLDVLGDGGRIIRAGYLPSDPGWYLQWTYLWFGGNIWDAEHEKFTLTDPRVVQAYQWMQSYSKRLGRGAMTEFSGAQGNYSSPQNAFMSGTIVMEQQGPWMANAIDFLKPSMSRVLWSKEVEMSKPIEERRKNYEWAVAPSPSISLDLKDVSYCGFDCFVIPRGAKHPREAFEFIAYVNRQDVMEKLCMMHSKNSPLAKVSDHYLNQHPNPYIDVFERLSASPNAQGVLKIPIMPRVSSEMANTAQLVLMGEDPQKSLEDLQIRLQAAYDQYMAVQRLRDPFVGTNP